MRELPTFNQLPNYKDLEGCAWEVWGKGDQLGTVNLLTDEVVREVAQEIKTGKTISLNWALNLPGPPLFHRMPMGHKIQDLAEYPGAALRDDELYINTQSGTQWDGLRHCGVVSHGVFYQGVSISQIKNGNSALSPFDNNSEQTILGMQNWADHGICGRGVLLDLERYYTTGGRKLPFDAMVTSPIKVEYLMEVAKAEGVEFRQGDILLLRVGFVKTYNGLSQRQRDELADKTASFAGIEQSREMKEFLWNNHFAAIASDQPSLEMMPPPGGIFLHQTIIGLWGMPIGEFFDLEALSDHCAIENRYAFFFSSWPLNVPGGVASPANAAVYF